MGKLYWERHSGCIKLYVHSCCFFLSLSLCLGRFLHACKTFANFQANARLFFMTIRIRVNSRKIVFRIGKKGISCTKHYLWWNSENSNGISIKLRIKTVILLKFCVNLSLLIYFEHDEYFSRWMQQFQLLKRMLKQKFYALDWERVSFSQMCHFCSWRFTKLRIHVY